MMRWGRDVVYCEKEGGGGAGRDGRASLMITESFCGEVRRREFESDGGTWSGRGRWDET